MPKITESSGLTEEEEIHLAAARKVCAALSDDDSKLIILLRINNNRLEYAFQNRPDPTLSGITDAVLMSAIIDAGKRYPVHRRKKLATAERVSGLRDSGDQIVYKDRVVVDFNNCLIYSTRKKETTLQAMAVVVQNLAENAARKAPPPSAAN